MADLPLVSRRRPARRRWRRRPAALLLLAGLAAALLAVPPAQARPDLPAPIGSDKFDAGQPYSGDFPDPSVIRVGRTYYAYSTTIASLNLPTISSTDLMHWTARGSNAPDGTWFLNDSMPMTGSWAQSTAKSRGRYFGSTWAPGALNVGGWFFAAYSAPVNGGSQRCIGISASTSPTGPFVDPSATPLVCPPGESVIDPSLYRQGKHTYLLWKGDTHPKIYERELNQSLTGFTPKSSTRVLLSPTKAWEGGTVENPAMVRYHKRLYLFYSANNYATASYATGYAVCKRVLGPCAKLRKQPFLFNGSGLEGPGGASPFFDAAGKLRLAYHAWRAGQTGYPTDNTCLQDSDGCAQRRLYIATLKAGGRGWLRTTSLF